MKCRVCIFLLLVSILCLTACNETTPTFVDSSVERLCAEPSWTGKTYALESLATQAVYIVEADVISVVYGDEHGVDDGDLTILHVRTALKGNLKGEITVRDTAWLNITDGEKPNTASIASERSLCGDPMMRTGHRVVLFLEPTEMTLSNGCAVYTLVDCAAVAKYFYDKDGIYHNALLYSEAYCADIELKGETQMPVLDDMTPKTLEQFRAMIGE